MTDWQNLFDHAETNPPLDPDLREAVSGSVMAPLDPAELAAVAADGGSPDGWQFPTQQLPASYLDFLCWSNGGFFLAGDREFQMLAAEELREYLLTYRLPYFMPGVVPFALDGAGNVYLFDLRADPSENEYPVLFAPTADLQFDAAVVLGASFPQVLADRSDPAGRLPS